MPVFSGSCKLLIDGRWCGGCTIAIEATWEAGQTFGFLSAPAELLKRAQAAKLTRVKLPNGLLPAISVLQVSTTGIALVAVKEQDKIIVRLSRGKWRCTIEADDPRDACVKAEDVFWTAKESGSPIQIAVRGGRPGAAQLVQDYLSGLLDDLDVEQHLPSMAELFPTKPRAAPAGKAQQQQLPGGLLAAATGRHSDMLMELDRRISRAQLMIEKQSIAVAQFTSCARSVDLAHSVLRTMQDSLSLLNRQRELLRRCMLA